MRSRRTFLKSALAGTAGAGLATTASSRAEAPTPPAAAAPEAPPRVDRRRLGRTEAQVSLLGLGLGSAFTRPYDQNRDAAHALLEDALARGINFWDTSRGYGNSEAMIAPVLNRHRDDIFLVTKSDGRTYDAFMRDVETSLKTLGTDRIDLLHLWNLKPQDDLDTLENGAARAAHELKQQGVAKHIGVTGHSGARLLMDAIRRCDPDAILTVFPCTRDDQGRYEDELLPLAIERDMGVIAMKTVRRARNADLVGTDLVRYAMSLEGVHCTIVGLDTPEHLHANANMATDFQPLDAQARDDLHREVSLAVADVPTPWEQPGYRDGQTYA
ncbi:MAG: aldo/keto reductase [Planctomycetota bacterium]